MIWGVSGFFIGILSRSYIVLNNSVIIFLLFLGLVFIIVGKFGKDRFYYSLAVLFIFAGAGIARYNLISPPKAITKIDFVTITDEPEETDTNIRYRTRIEEGTRLLVYGKPQSKYEYGDKLKLTGKVTKIEDFESDTGEVVAWADYWAKEEIYYQILYPKIELVSKDNGNWLQAKLFYLKQAFLANISKRIAEPESSLAGGLVVGAKESMGKALLDKFRIAGLIHMVVLSGYNITIVALGIMWLLQKRFSLKVSTIAGVVTIILFAIMVGGGATVFRASIMAVLALVARSTGRINQVTRALVLAAVVMLVINPKLLVFDTGFQLSFLATLGLIYLAPIFEKYFTKLPERILWLPVREVAAATAGAQLAVLPLILYIFGNFSIYAFPVNILVLPFVPTVMLLVFLTGTIAFIPIINVLALPFAWASYILLAYFVGLVNLVSRLPLANLNIAHIPIILVIIMYLAIILFVGISHKKQEHLEVTPPSA